MHHMENVQIGSEEIRCSTFKNYADLRMSSRCNPDCMDPIWCTFMSAAYSTAYNQNPEENVNNIFVQGNGSIDKHYCTVEF